MKKYSIKSKISFFWKLCRPEQNYKNLVIFAAIFFSGNLFHLGKFITVFYGFIALSLMSSANYIINDILDRKNDVSNPEKSSRPIASNKVNISHGAILAALLFILSTSIAFFLGMGFVTMILSFFSISSLYSLYLKHELFLDIIAISVNFVIKAVSGALIITVWISPWLIIGTFFISLFLVAGKRKSEMRFLKKKASKHRKVLGLYSNSMMDIIISVTTSALLISYALYSSLGTNFRLLFTLPIVFYLVLRYLYIIYSESEIARMPYKIFSDRRFCFALIAYLVVALIALY